MSIAGGDGDDAKRYQERAVRAALAELRGTEEVIVNASEQHYSMTIEWSDEDQVYVVTVPELPGCTTHGATYEEAVRQGQAAIESWVCAMRAWGRPVPAPRVYAGVA